MATTADFRNGLCIVFKDDLYTIVQFQHVKPGKGPAFVRTKLRNVKTGRILENTFTSGIKIDVARIERRPYQFLYKEGEDYVMMHTETYEQLNIAKELINAPQFLKEGDAVEMVVHADTETPLYVELLPNVVLEVTYTGFEGRYGFFNGFEGSRGGDRSQSDGTSFCKYRGKNTYKYARRFLRGTREGVKRRKDIYGETICVEGSLFYVHLEGQTGRIRQSG